jgi:hypothetical protein
MAFYPPSGSAQQLVMTTNVQLDYPYSTNTTNTTVTDIIDISATVPSLNVYLPNAQLTGPGFSIAFNNVGANDIDIVLNDGVTILYSIAPSQAISIYLYDNTTVNGNWRIVEVGGGVSAISSLTIESTDTSINVANGAVTSPSGTVDITLPSIISSITELGSTIPGVVVINQGELAPWNVTLIVGTSNITIVNPDGANFGAPIEISLDDSVVISQLQAGNVIINNDSITNTDANGVLSVTSNGANSALNLNSVLITPSGKISGVTELEMETGSEFKSANVSKAWCRFTNTSGTIAVTSAYNISSVTLNAGQYTITFIDAMANIEYAVFISCANNNSSPPLQTRMGYDIIKQEGSLVIVLTDSSGENLLDIPEGVSVMVYSLT